jgi:hypothetical protein
MRETKWTSGPWRIESDINSNEAASDHLVMTSDGAHIVARTTEDANAIGWDRVAANARLIASAPDLYAALDALVNGPRVLMEPAEYQANAKRARAVLAAAKGEASRPRSIEEWIEADPPPCLGCGQPYGEHRDGDEACPTEDEGATYMNPEAWDD